MRCRRHERRDGFLMTKRWLRFGVITLSCLLTIATSAFAESSWVIWQQDFIFTEHWWIPKGWLFRKTTTPSTPIARWESPTLDKCQTMRFQVALQDLKLLGVVAQQGGNIDEWRTGLSLYACVPFGQRPEVIEPGGGWK